MKPVFEAQAQVHEAVQVLIAIAICWDFVFFIFTQFFSHEKK